MTLKVSRLPVHPARTVSPAPRYALPKPVKRSAAKLTARELLGEIQKDIPFYDTSGGGVTFSGGEPLLQAEFLIEVLKLCGDEHIHRAVDTSGYASYEILMAVAGHSDLFLYDLKMMDPAKHEKFTGVSNRLILDNLVRLARERIDLIIRIPLIPGVNDDGKTWIEPDRF